MKKAVLSSVFSVLLSTQTIFAGGLDDPIVEPPVDAPTETKAEMSKDERIAFTVMTIAAALAIGPGALIPAAIAGTPQE